MNIHQSSIRRFTARNVIEKAIAPPGNLTLLTTDPVRQIFNTGFFAGNQLSRDQMMIVRRIGLFCNVADGLVPLTPSVRIDVQVRAAIMQQAANPIQGTSSRTINSKNVAGTLTNYVADLAVGDIVYFSGAVPGLHIIGSIGGALACTVNDYSLAPAGACGVYKLTALDTQETTLRGLTVLNDMQECERFITIALSSIPQQCYIVLTAIISMTGNYVFGTQSIAAGYSGETALFDVSADIEVAPTGIV